MIERSVQTYARAYDVARDVYAEPAREDGLEPIEPEFVPYGDNVKLLAGDRSIAVEMRIAGSHETKPTRPIFVRPAYRPEPRARLEVEELFPRRFDVGSIATWFAIILAVLYFGGHVLHAAIVAR